jgi:hypothetical protein
MTSIVVTGGADSIAAHLDDLLAMAAFLRTTATVLDDALDDLTAPMQQWTVAEGATADPAGIAAIHAHLGALVGELRACDDEIAGLGFSLIAAVASYRQAEQAVSTSFAERFADDILGSASLVPPGLVASLAAVPERDVSALFALPRLLAPILPDGHAMLHDLGRDDTVDIPPRSLSDLVLDLSARNRGRPGEISVSFVTGADGRRRAIVDIPGTKSWNPMPVADVTSVDTDIIAIAGRTTSYERGIFAALDDAGVSPDTEVMLVGHSEGGIVAVDAARDAAASGRYRITHVVTAGSPVGELATGLPANVQLLSLENDADIVPALDNVPNPDLANVTTVRVNDDHGSIGANHDLDTTYVPAAVAAQTAGDGSVDAFLHSADEFLDANTVSTHAYQITRSG